MLLAAGHRVIIAYDGKIGWKLTRDQAFDVIILSPDLAGINGYELVRSIRYLDRQTAILMLLPQTTTSDEEHRKEVGIDRYLGRPIGEAELTTCIDDLYWLTLSRLPRWIRLEQLELNLSERMVYREGHAIELSERECHLLAILMQYQGRVLSKKQLLTRIWGADQLHRLNLVEVFITYLRRKIDQDFSHKFIHTVHGIGYRLIPIHVDSQPVINQ